ncbi:MAG TPA: hypothetical protein VGL86_03705 [Polyangia bacterium]
MREPASSSRSRDDEHALDGRLVFAVAGALDPFFGSRAFERFGAAENLQADTIGIIDGDDGDAVVGRQIARADVLLVAAKTGERDRLRIDDFEKTLRYPRRLPKRSCSALMAGVKINDPNLWAIASQ